jgi:hypothetical protein
MPSLCCSRCCAACCAVNRSRTFPCSRRTVEGCSQVVFAFESRFHLIRFEKQKEVPQWRCSRLLGRPSSGSVEVDDVVVSWSTADPPKGLRPHSTSSASRRRLARCASSKINRVLDGRGPCRCRDSRRRAAHAQQVVERAGIVRRATIQPQPVRRRDIRPPHIIKSSGDMSSSSIDLSPIVIFQAICVAPVCFAKAVTESHRFQRLMRPSGELSPAFPPRNGAVSSRAQDDP